MTACDNGGKSESPSQGQLVRAASIEAAGAQDWSVTGVVRANREMPLAFRIAGEIRERRITAGSRVQVGDILFILDPRDLSLQLEAAKANLRTAKAEAENAESELKRQAQLRDRGVVAQQTFDRAATAAVGARERIKSVEAVLAQASNAVEYTVIKALTDGVIVEVSAEAGQVVAAGQQVAVLAASGHPEAEIFVPEVRRQSLPRIARARIFGANTEIGAVLSELAGSADPATRTWRARYRLEISSVDVPFGATVTLFFKDHVDSAEKLKRVPVSAVFDNGKDTVVWQIIDNKVQPRSVTLKRVDDEYAFIETDLPINTAIVALGVHLLQTGQVVRIKLP